MPVREEILFAKKVEIVVNATAILMSDRGIFNGYNEAEMDEIVKRCTSIAIDILLVAEDAVREMTFDKDGFPK